MKKSFQLGEILRNSLFSVSPSALLLILALLVLPAGCGFSGTGSNGLQIATQGTNGKVTVTILDATTQRPVGNAQVSLYDSRGRQIGSPLTTGPDGTVTFTNLPIGGDYLIRARAGGQYAEGISDTTVDSTSQVQATIKLDPFKANVGTLAGAVRDANTREPVAGARAVLDNRAATAVQTNSDGLFIFKNIPLGTHIVTLTKDDYQTLNFRIPVNQVGLVTSIGDSLDLVPVRQFGIGRTLIADLGNDRVIEVDRKGGIIWSSGSVRFPTSATRLTSGATLVSSSGDNKVLELSASKAVTWSFGGSLLGLGSKLKDPQWIARSADGRRLLVADQGHDRVVEIDRSSGQIVWTYTSDLSQPRSAVYLDNGNILIANSGYAQVVEVSRSGQKVWAYGDTLVKPTFAQRLSNGSTLITDMGSNTIVEVRDNGGVVSTFSSGLRLPRTALRLPSGNTLIADTGNNRVIEMGKDSEVVWEYSGVSQPMSAERIG